MPRSGLALPELSRVGAPELVTEGRGDEETEGEANATVPLALGEEIMEGVDCGVRVGVVLLETEAEGVSEGLGEEVAHVMNVLEDTGEKDSDKDGDKVGDIDEVRVTLVAFDDTEGDLEPVEESESWGGDIVLDEDAVAAALVDAMPDSSALKEGGVVKEALLVPAPELVGKVEL